MNLVLFSRSCALALSVSSISVSQALIAVRSSWPEALDWTEEPPLLPILAWPCAALLREMLFEEVEAAQSPNFVGMLGTCGTSFRMGGEPGTEGRRLLPLRITVAFDVAGPLL